MNICNYTYDPNILTQRKVNAEFALIHQYLCYLAATGGGGGAVSSVFGRTGTVTAQSGDYTFSQIGSTPTTLAGYGITDPVVLTTGAYANPTWITQLAASKLSGTVSVAAGGTGLNSYTTGDILFASAPTGLASLTDVATGNVILSGGVGVAPSYGKVGLTTHITGILPVANGGTGTATPGLVQGTNITITGSWPNQTINASGGGGSPAGSTADIQFNNAGSFAADTGLFTYTAGTHLLTTPSLTVNTSLTGSSATKSVSITPTWNTTGVPTALFVNPSNTASGAGSLLMDLQLTNSSKFKVDTTGAMTATASATITNAAGAFFIAKRGSSTFDAGFSSSGDAIVGTGSGTDGMGLYTNGAQRARIDSTGFLSLTEAGPAGPTNFDLRQRTGVSLGFPVTAFRPTNGPNQNMAVDVMPIGSPGNFSGNGVCWVDVCNADCLLSSLTTVQTARIGVSATSAIFGSAAFGSVITPIPVVFVINLVEVARFDTSGNLGINQNTPLSRLDVVGAQGYNQFRMETSYTPTSSADANGNTGDVAWDSGFVYIKTGPGAWKRAALSTF